VKNFKLLSLILVFIVSDFALSADFKMRAREHYEIHTVQTPNKSQVFRGLSNTINFWWEEPFDISYGFALSPVLASLKSDSTSPLGDEILYYNLGGEVKFFPKVALENIYIRAGLAYAMILPGEGSDLTGVSFYSGIGYEIPIGNVGLALEVGNRVAFLTDSTMVTSLIPSLGVHFYDLF